MKQNGHKEKTTRIFSFSTEASSKDHKLILYTKTFTKIQHNSNSQKLRGETVNLKKNVF